jgi:hypothetical protein
VGEAREPALWDGLVVLAAGAVGVDLLNAPAGERGELFDDRAVDQDAEAAAANRAVLQWSAINHNLPWLICCPLESGSERHLIARPGHVEMRDILNSEGNSDEHVWTLQSDAIDSILHGVSEEVRPAGRMWRLRATPR